MCNLLSSDSLIVKKVKCMTFLQASCLMNCNILSNYPRLEDTERIDHLIQFLDVPTYNSKDVQNKLPYNNNGEAVLLLGG